MEETPSTTQQNTTRGASLDMALMMLEVLRLLPRKRYITATQVQAALAAAGHDRSLRTIQRLLEQLTAYFPIEQDVRSRPFGYRWANEAQGFQLASLTPAEALLLQIARVHIHDFLPSRVARQLDDLFTTAEKTIESKPSTNIDKRWLKKVRRVPSTQPLLPPKLNNSVFEAVSEALYYEQKLKVVYINAKGEKREAVVWPLGLALQEPRLYIVCRFEGYDNERILSLARLQKAEVLTESFVYPKGFKLSDYDGEGRFAFGEGKQVALSFRIDKLVGRHLTESPLALDQQLVEEENCLAITATVTDSLLLHSWLRGLGKSVWDVHLLSME